MFVATILIQLELSKILVFLFLLILNGPNISITFTLDSLYMFLSGLKAFSSKNVWTLLKSFITNFRPKLEYNSPVRNPYLKKDILLLKSAQKKFTRNIFLCCNIPFKSYADRLNKLGIKSLEYCRLEFDIILMFKIYHNLFDLPFDNYFEHCDKMYNLRSHDQGFRTGAGARSPGAGGFREEPELCLKFRRSWSRSNFFQS